MVASESGIGFKWSGALDKANWDEEGGRGRGRAGYLALETAIFGKLCGDNMVGFMR